MVDFSKKSFIFVEIFLVKTSLHIFKKGVTCATFREMHGWQTKYGLLYRLKTNKVFYGFLFLFGFYFTDWEYFNFKKQVQFIIC